MFAEIAKLLQHWSSIPISLLGRINILKMSVLPKLLYLFETLPVPVSMSQLRNLQRKCLNFVWNNASHRIAQSVVLSPRTRGGLASPDFIKYYYASHLRVLTTWTSRKAANNGPKLKWGLLPLYIRAICYGHPQRNS